MTSPDPNALDAVSHVQQIPASKKSRGEDFQIFEAKVAPLSDLESDRAWGLMLANHAEAARDPREAHEAVLRLERVRRLLPHDPDLLDRLALASFLDGQPSVAVEHWMSILSIDPQHHDALYSLSIVVEQQGDLRKAAVYGEKLLRNRPWDDQTQFRMAGISLRLGRREEAQQYAQQAMQLNPSRMDYYRWQADNFGPK